MSWGERSCVYLYADVKPCKPSYTTCNVNCKQYTYDGISTPDSSKTIQKDNIQKEEHTGLNRAQRRAAAKRRK